MSTIDIDTTTGLVKIPMRRVSGAEEVRVRAWIELVTMRGEWLTNTASGIDYDAITDGASDEEIQADVSSRLELIPNVTRVVDVEVVRDNEAEPPTLTITAKVEALDTEIQVTVGAATP